MSIRRMMGKIFMTASCSSNSEDDETSSLVVTKEQQRSRSQETLKSYLSVCEEDGSTGAIAADEAPTNTLLHGGDQPSSTRGSSRLWLLLMLIVAALGALFYHRLVVVAAALEQEQASLHNSNQHRTMVPLIWDHHQTAHIEFCQTSNTTFGYRLLGEPSCGPAGLVIRLVPGQTYRLILHNTARTVTTNVHTHGLHLSGSGNADDVTRHVEPGNCLIYDWEIPVNALGGTFWLHAHPTTRNSPATEQLRGGAFSMLIVEDHPQLLSQVESRYRPSIQQWLRNELLLITFHTSGGETNTAYTSSLGRGGGSNDDSVLHLDANIWYRLRVLTIDPRGKRVPLEFASSSSSKCHVHLAATDGVWLRNGTPHVTEQRSFDPTGAGRMEFAVMCPDSGQFPILVHSMQVATLHVVDGRRRRSSRNSLASPFVVEADYEQQLLLRSWKATFPSYLQDLSSIEDDGDGIVFEHHDMISVNRTINGQSWDPQTPLLSIDYDSYQEWHLIGTATHPFHIHVFHVQTFNCPPHVDGQFYDTIMSTSDDDCRVRFHVTDFSQRIVVHCHNVVHEDQGMMVWFNVTNGGPVQDTAYREELACQSVPDENQWV